MADKICMIIDNILIFQIYVAHSMVVVVHNLWNPDMDLTTFSPYFLHVGIVILVHYCTPLKTIFTSITVSLSLSLGPVTVPRYLAHYKVVLFQPRAEDTQTLDSGLYLELVTLVY